MSKVIHCELRRARLEDARALAELGDRAWRAAYAGLMPERIFDALTPEVRAARWRAALTRVSRGRATWIAARSAGLLGYCTHGPARSRAKSMRATGEILSIYVDPPAQSQGLGRSLLSHALAQLQRQGCAQVVLWVLSSNVRARQFYERAGFEPDVPQRWVEVEGERLAHARYRLVLPRSSENP